MPGCYFTVAGREFEPDAFLAAASLTAYSVWHVGEPIAKVGRRALQIHETSGFACDVSKIDGDLSGQVRDAIAFLSANRTDLAILAEDPTLQEFDV